jgi:NADH dehydrogenase
MALLSRQFLNRRAQPRIVIAGANFAGLAVARGLSASRFRVTVIDPEPMAEWLPNIHELLSRRKRPEQLQHDRRMMIERMNHEFIQEAVTSIDADDRRVMTSGGSHLDYDYLVVAIGTVSSSTDIPGARDHAIKTKSVADCHRISNALTRLAAMPGNRSVAVVGGGIEGIEMLGEILRRFGGQDRLDLHLIEGRSRLFDRFPGMHEHLLHRMGKDVTVHCGQGVRAVSATGLTLENGQEINARLSIWTAGSQGHPLLADAGLGPTGSNAPVTATLQSPSHPDIFIIGDAASLPYSLEKQAYHAQDMGRYVAEHLPQLTKHRSAPPFRPHPKPSLVSFGDRDAFMIFGNRLIATPTLLGLKEAVYQYGYHDMMPPRSRHELSVLLRDLRQGINTLDTRRMLAGSTEARLFEAR